MTGPPREEVESAVATLNAARHRGADPVKGLRWETDGMRAWPPGRGEAWQGFEVVALAEAIRRREQGRRAS